MNIIEIRDEKSLMSLRERWNNLLFQSKSNTIFLTWEWIFSWWKNFRHNENLFVLIVEDGSGEILGIAPFYIVKTRFLGLLPIKCIRFLGDRSAGSEYLDFIIVENKEEEVLKEIFNYLDANDHIWDIAILKEIPEISINLKYLSIFSDLKYLSVLSQDSEYVFSRTETVCSSVPLPEDWNSYLMSLKPRFRTKIRSCRRRLAESHEIEFRDCPEKNSLKRELNYLFELHQARWVQSGFEGSFSILNNRQFYCDIASYFLENNWLRLYSLEIDGKVVACQFGFEYDKKLFHLQEGWDTNYKDQNLGITLRSYVFEDIISKGLKEYDFLGGINRHKRDWGAVPKCSVNVLLGKSNLKNELFRWLPVFVEGGKQIIEKMLPKRLVEYRRKKIIRTRERKVRKNAERLLNIG